jgi:hypothetical protein
MILPPQRGTRGHFGTRKGASNFIPDTFVLLVAASGPRDELQAAASGMTVGKQDCFLSVAEIGDILAHAASGHGSRAALGRLD